MRPEYKMATVPLKLSAEELAWLNERCRLGARGSYWGDGKPSRSQFIRNLVRAAMNDEKLLELVAIAKDLPLTPRAREGAATANLNRKAPHFAPGEKGVKNAVHRPRPKR